jgi:FkbM family methyltransferase
MINKVFCEFLAAISRAELHDAYYLLHKEFSDPVDEKIATELKAICTSHFLRQRAGKLHSLSNLSNSGFCPTVVFDVGAQIGTPELYAAFPYAHHIFIEPVAECVPVLSQIASQLHSATVINCAVSNVNGMTSLSLTPSRQYSSIDLVIGGETREIEVRTVDSIYEELNIQGPILLKIDVDGIEIKVLQGSKAVLRGDCVVVIEASMGDENPRFTRVVEYLTSYGFEVFDIVDPLYRLSDWHLWQVDLVFAKKGSPLWGSKNYV